MLVMSFHYLIQSKSGILIRKSIASELWYTLVFRSHVLFGLIAIFFGPIQFFNLSRHGFRKPHAIRGYIYSVSILLSGLAGLIIAPFAMGGPIASIGFSILAVLWIYLTGMAVVAIRRKNAQLHRSLMILSYALTFAAITQRTLLLVPLLTAVPFLPVYQLSAWLPWILNLSIAYLIIRRQKMEPLRV